MSLEKLIPIFLSLIATATTVLLAIRNARMQRELEAMKMALQKQLASDTALISYQFEARKKLYSECEPLFFQMSEASCIAFEKCTSLAKEEVCAALRPGLENRGEDGPWMLNNSTELISTLYALLHPLAIFVLLRERMTFVDCSLDAKVAFRYELARLMFSSFYDERTIAAMRPSLRYDPFVKDWRQARMRDPARHWWQGVSHGRLDRAVRLLIAREGGIARVITFGEFEDLYLTACRGTDVATQKRLGVAANALYGFTPAARPVFWRLVLVQAHLHNAMRRELPEDLAAIRTDSERLDAYLRMPPCGVRGAANGKTEDIARRYVIDELMRTFEARSIPTGRAPS